MIRIQKSVGLWTKEYVPKNSDKIWIKEVSSKAVKQSIVNAERAFKRFFKKLGGFPKYKKKRVEKLLTKKSANIDMF